MHMRPQSSQEENQARVICSRIQEELRYMAYASAWRRFQV